MIWLVGYVMYQICNWNSFYNPFCGSIIIMIIVVVLVINSKNLKKKLVGLEIKRKIRTVQTKALLRSARILRRVLESWGDCHLEFQKDQLVWKKKETMMIICCCPLYICLLSDMIRVFWNNENTYVSLKKYQKYYCISILHVLDIGEHSNHYPNGPGDLGSIPGWVNQRLKKWYLMPSCLTFSI